MYLIIQKIIQHKYGNKKYNINIFRNGLKETP